MTRDEILSLRSCCSSSGNALSWAQLSTGLRGALRRSEGSEICNGEFSLLHHSFQGNIGLNFSLITSCLYDRQWSFFKYRGRGGGRREHR